MQREISSFPVAPVHLTKLQNAGYTTVQDILEVKPSQLSKDAAITKEEALDILTMIRAETDKATKPNSSNSHTALELLQDEHHQQHIITFSQQLDEMLGGGVPLTKITEFCGAPGIGKTQISMQLAVDVQIPESMGGVGGKAVYIDTEGSFVIDRVADMARATVDHCNHIAAATDDSSSEPELTFESVLGGIYYFRCHDYVELAALVHLLPEFVKEHPKVRLVIVDSIAFHFRHDFEDLALRTRLLNGMSQSFIKLANQHKLAVVLTNQMTTKISSESSHLVPALGESWGHASTVRVVLYWENNQRYALLYKSPNKKETTVPYQVTTAGIRDISQDVNSNDSSQHDGPAPKRQRVT